MVISGQRACPIAYHGLVFLNELLSFVPPPGHLALQFDILLIKLVSLRVKRVLLLHSLQLLFQIVLVKADDELLVDDDRFLKCVELGRTLLFKLSASALIAASWHCQRVRELALLDLWHALNKKLLLVSQIQLQLFLFVFFVFH